MGGVAFSFISGKKLAFIYIAIILVAAALRFYNLGEPAKPVFDEVYFPKFAYGYIEQKPFYHSHPPLAKYVFAAAMQIYYLLPWADDAVLGVSKFSDVAPIAYRWINAVFGVLLVGIVGAICWRLSCSHRFTVTAMTFVAIDGAIVAASRFGLSNVQVLMWGFLALAFIVFFLSSQKRHWSLWCAAVAFGCVICVKWNGLGYWLIALALLVGLGIMRMLNVRTQSEQENSFLMPIALVQSWRLVDLGKLVLAFFVIPVVVYSVLWVPDRALNTKESFTQIHAEYWGYHSDRVSDDSHPYCSKWYSWPIMQRPISFEFSKRLAVVDDKKVSYYSSIHSFGNPLLYWLASTAMAVLTLAFLYFAGRALLTRVVPNHFFCSMFIVLGYFSSWLPWSMVSRCTFLYHYQTASIFSFLALAYCLNYVASKGVWGKWVFTFVLAIIAWSFVYFLPFTLGLELEQSDFYDRMWFQIWI